jgi:uncharacterized protein (TIGR00269 family)
MHSYQKYNNIIVGLSGGKDSVAMLHILKKLGYNISVITIDGGIKGYDDKLIKNTKKVCKDLAVKQHIFTFKKEFNYTIDDIAQARPGTCNCGVFRRQLLNKKARELKADALAIGHNLDDEVETILLNVIRGDVSKMTQKSNNKKFVPRIKPLHRSPENEVVLYAKLIYPKMNFNIKCPYRKQVLRLNIKKLIDQLERKHPGIKYQIFNGNEKLKQHLKLVSRKLYTCKYCKEPCSGKVCNACLLKQEIDEILS